MDVILYNQDTKYKGQAERPADPCETSLSHCGSMNNETWLPTRAPTEQVTCPESTNSRLMDQLESHSYDQPSQDAVETEQTYLCAVAGCASSGAVAEIRDHAGRVCLNAQQVRGPWVALLQVPRGPAQHKHQRRLTFSMPGRQCRGDGELHK